MSSQADIFGRFILRLVIYSLAGTLLSSVAFGMMMFAVTTDNTGLENARLFSGVTVLIGLALACAFSSLMCALYYNVVFLESLDKEKSELIE